MKFLVRNIETRKPITQPTSLAKAEGICNRMNELYRKNSFKILFEVVPVSTVFSELSTEKRPMTLNEVEAISKLKDVKYNPQTRHSDFASSLIELAKKPETQITEKQSVYLWHIVYHYRNQIGDERIINIAKERKGY